ncbi:MAG: hypothetical protein JXQ75_02225, partial [Phycisphaerae bacterium]|nr:hypothetical protein [Phycisphaerae bacterium]
VSDGNIVDADQFSLFECIFTNQHPDKVLDSVTISTDPFGFPDGQHRYAGVFAINGAARYVTHAWIEPREVAFIFSPGWRVFDRFDTHNWQGRWSETTYGKFDPFDPYYDGWKHAFRKQFSTAHPVEGEMGLKVEMPIAPAARFNWMHFETDLPEPEDWSDHKIMTYDPYMEGSPLGLPLMGLIVENTTGFSRVPLILGWQLFQWENRQMTWPLQGNVEAGVVDGETQWQIPPIPMDYLTNVVKVSCGFEYYFDPHLTKTCVHMDNMRLGAVSMWDSFEGPQYGWHSADTNVRVGVTHNQRFDDSAGSLLIKWPSVTNYVCARTGEGWKDHWQAFSHIRLRVYATAGDTRVRLSVNGQPTAVATNKTTGEWEVMVWDMPAGITEVTNLEIGVVNPAAGGKIYVDHLEVGSEPGRVTSVAGWALKDANRLRWSLSAIENIEQVIVRYDTTNYPASATNGQSLVAINNPTELSYIAAHEGPTSGETYYYAFFVKYAGGGYSSLTMDSGLRLSRDLLVVSGDSYEAAFSKENGALVYVHDAAADSTVCYGNEDACLWRMIFVGEEHPDLLASWFSPSDPSFQFTYTESPLVLHYDYSGNDGAMDLAIAVDATETNRLRLHLALTNNLDHAIRTVECPRRIQFSVTNVNRVAFPIQEGMAFTRGFFEEGRYSIQPRPWLFADFIGLDSVEGLFSLYAIQDSFYGVDILPQHDPAKPVFQPSNLGVGRAMNDRCMAFMDYEMVTYIPPGGAWSGPTLVLETGGSSLRSPVAHYRQLNEFADTNRYPTLKQKLDAFGLFEKIAGSPVMAIECDKVVNWKKAPMGEMWSKVRDTWLDVLPRDNILHFTHWQKGILEDEHPDCQPIQWERYGDYADFTNMVDFAHEAGWLVMPFCNWTVWNKHHVVQRDASGTLLPIEEGCLKVTGAPFYEYLGYMVKPWHTNVYEVHSNMMVFYQTEQPMDTMFVDMTCERTWRYTRIDTDGDKEDETIFTGYTQATIDHNNYLKQFFPLYTEGVMDQMMGEIAGYCQTHRQKMMMDILRHVGDEFDNWVIFPLAADVAHEHVGFYQHDLNLQVFPRTKPLITHYTVMGYSYIVDVATWYGEVDADGWNWMYICDDFQKGVVSKYFGLPLTDYEGAVDGDIRRIRTKWGTDTNEVVVLANFKVEPWATGDYTIAPQGFMATMSGNRLIAGIFTNLFNGAALAEGENTNHVSEHFICVERMDEHMISVKHPAGPDTEISIPLPASWTGQVCAAFILRDGTEVFAAGRARKEGANVIVGWTERTDAGAPVAAMNIRHAVAESDPLFLEKPFVEADNETQVWVRVRADRPVRVVVHYGLHSMDEFVVTNDMYSLTHAVAIDLPDASQGTWLRVEIIDEDGHVSESGR